MDIEIAELELCGLVSDAKRGDQASMSRLTELVRDNLRSYIYRLTLNQETTDDILQETLLSMVESLKDLRRADRFWAWLLRTALGKVQNHFRKQKQKRKEHMWAVAKGRLSNCSTQIEDVIGERLMQQELSDAIFDAMNKLSLSYRNVLVLRCFEQFSFEEIGEMLECSELRARVTFFRAKHCLRSKLARRGFGRKTFFVMAVGLFGLLTAPAKAGTTAAAAGTVTATSFEVGTAASVIGFLGTKIGIATATILGGMTVTLAINAFLWFTALVLMLLIFVVVAAFSR